jgi:hypothetical protein
LIGELKEKFMQTKTNDKADLAGLSQPMDLLKLKPPSKDLDWETSLNNN